MRQLAFNELSEISGGFSSQDLNDGYRTSFKWLFGAAVGYKVYQVVSEYTLDHLTKAAGAGVAKRLFLNFGDITLGVPLGLVAGIGAYYAGNFLAQTFLSKS